MILFFIFFIYQMKRNKGNSKNNNDSVIYDSDDSSEENNVIKQKNEELKKSFYCHREFEEITLNPKWTNKVEGRDMVRNGVFYIPLPCPKKILFSSSENVPNSVNNSTCDVDTVKNVNSENFVYNNESNNNNDDNNKNKNNSNNNYNNNESNINNNNNNNSNNNNNNNNNVNSDNNGNNGLEKEKENININDGPYNKACKSLLEYWSLGIIKIQVVDGERFNEDIFLGEVSKNFHFLL